ncbi:MAG: aryl-sulfate sulfotransferase [Lachnospiraceae bacterium]|nr:aryl-sulfate sulfotransferase [Lachnospiraceae bacterium]
MKNIKYPSYMVLRNNALSSVRQFLLTVTAALFLSIACTLTLLPTSFASAEEATVVYEAAGWQITLEDVTRSASLSAVSVELGYTSVETTDIEQTASDGCEYCMLKLSFVKNGSMEAIEWEKLFLIDGDGNSYTRIDDSFITDFGMSRLPGTALNFGSYEGWICFEIPAEASDLTLVYAFESEELTIPVDTGESEAADDSDENASSESADETTGEEDTSQDAQTSDDTENTAAEDASGNTEGATDGETSDSTDGATDRDASGSTDGATDGDASGSTDGTTGGDASGSTDSTGENEASGSEDSTGAEATADAQTAAEAQADSTDLSELQTQLESEIAAASETAATTGDTATTEAAAADAASATEAAAAQAESETETEPQLVATETLYDVDGRSWTVVSSEEIAIEADLSTELSMPEQTQAISDAIVASVEEYGSTFEDPLLIQNPYQNAPLTAVLAFETTEECSVRVTVKGKSDGGVDISDTIDAATLHIVPILGLYAGYDNEVVVELLAADETVLDALTLTITTEGLPSALADAVSTESTTASSAMGLMLISGLSSKYAYAFDETGEIRWYSSTEWEYYGVFPLENGHFLIEAENVLYPNASMPNSPEFWEMDYLGRVYNVYYFPNGVHHDITEKTPDGNFMILTNSNDGYEQNMIQEIDRETGEVVKSLCLNDLFEGLSYIDRDDWCHTNTVSYDEETDSILISCRNLHSVIRIDWTTDEILWILADPTVWEGTGYENKLLTATEDFQWQYQQHAAYILEEDLDGNPDTVEIMLFDNHSDAYRAVSTFDDTSASYVKIYSVDQDAMTVTLLKNYETAYSSITSNTFYLSDAGRVFSVNAHLPSSEEYRGKVYEIDYESGEILNIWNITRRFYRGYSISLSMNDCAGAYTLSDNYIRGTLRMPVEIEATVESEDTIASGDDAEIEDTANAEDAAADENTADAENAVADENAADAENAAADENAADAEATSETEYAVETISEDLVSVTLCGSILYVQSRDHLYTQIIFNGEEHTYVYDISDITLASDEATNYYYELPIPLSEMAADTYTIQIMYDNQLYDIEGSFTIS